MQSDLLTVNETGLVIDLLCEKLIYPSTWTAEFGTQTLGLKQSKWEYNCLI